MIECDAFKSTVHFSWLTPKDRAQNSEQTDHGSWLADSNSFTTNRSKKGWIHSSKLPMWLLHISNHGFCLWIPIGTTKYSQWFGVKLSTFSIYTFYYWFNQVLISCSLWMDLFLNLSLFLQHCHWLSLLFWAFWYKVGIGKDSSLSHTTPLKTCVTLGLESHHTPKMNQDSDFKIDTYQVKFAEFFDTCLMTCWVLTCY